MAGTGEASRPSRPRDPRPRHLHERATFDPRTPKGQGMVGYKISDFDVSSMAHRRGVVRAGGRCRARHAESTQKPAILDVFRKEPHRWVKVASHPRTWRELARRGWSCGRFATGEKKELLAAREGVWRAWAAGARDASIAAAAASSVTIEPESDALRELKTKLERSEGSPRAVPSTCLRFPDHEFQAYVRPVILYTTYEHRPVRRRKDTDQRGAATELFVHRNCQSSTPAGSSRDPLARRRAIPGQQALSIQIRSVRRSFPA